MSCGMECIKYLLFIFNFIFALGGLAILVCGILLQTAATNSNLQDIPVNAPVIGLIIIGAIIFIIAFFGCCGAIRESHCMIITFAITLLTLLVIQIAIAVYVFVKVTDSSANAEQKLEEHLRKLVDDYYTYQTAQSSMDFIQYWGTCCGYDSYNDFLQNPKNINRTIPSSCCKNDKDLPCSTSQVDGIQGCGTKVWPIFKSSTNAVAGLSIGVAVIEVIGIIFACCLANSIRNAHRRGYKV